MKNPDYSPETAHLPSARDNELWKKYYRQKNKDENERMKKFKAKCAAVEKSRAEIDS